MKLQYKSKFEKFAKDFATHIKAERQLDSTITEQDGVYTVEYSIADYCGEKSESGDKPCNPTFDDLSRWARYIFDEIQYQSNWFAARISYVENEFYRHISSGHLPPIEGPEKMQKAIDALGIGGDYKVEKRTVYASTIEVDFPDTKK